jgi:hypothetical protein
MWGWASVSSFSSKFAADAVGVDGVSKGAVSPDTCVVDGIVKWNNRGLSPVRIL